MNEYKNSVHFKASSDDEGATCTGCHNQSAHKIQPISNNKQGKNKLCAGCHESPNEKYKHSLHGEALAQKKHLAPNCITCHGGHGVLSPSDENAETYVMNIPALCGECHKEGTEVSELEDVNKNHVFEDYSQSIHGDGLFRRGLIVTAVCTSCHNSHEILHSEDPKSSINKENIPKTCMRCHAQIESVHKKIIRGELWEKQPDDIPVCADCHQPHKVRRVFYNENFPDESCMICHKEEDIYKTENGVKINLTVDTTHLQHSAHEGIACIKCHTNVTNQEKSGLS
ncbi:MAG: cytochrome c3 family protein [Bacteroidales bacterium]|nr:cytochrome c3 family protein [Bacteroidales bacterium]